MLNNLDCGDNSCLFAEKITGMRTNGGCRCQDRIVDEIADEDIRQEVKTILKAVKGFQNRAVFVRYLDEIIASMERIKKERKSMSH